MFSAIPKGLFVKWNDDYVGYDRIMRDYQHRLMKYSRDMAEHKRSREFWTNPALGTPPNVHEIQKNKWQLQCDRGHRAIRELHVVTRSWDNRTVIQGFAVHLANGSVHKFGLDRHQHHHHGQKIVLQIPHGEHISNTNARSGYYVDQLEFITSRGRMLGPVGGSDGQGDR